MSKKKVFLKTVGDKKYWIYDAQNFRGNKDDKRYLVERVSDQVQAEFSVNEVTDGTFDTWLGLDTYADIVEWYDGGAKEINFQQPLAQNRFFLLPQNIINDTAQARHMHTGLDAIPTLVGADVIMNYVFRYQTNNNNQRSDLWLLGSTITEIFAIDIFDNKVQIKWDTTATNASQATFPISGNTKQWQTITLFYTGGVVTKGFLNGVEQTLGAGNAQGCRAGQSSPFNVGVLGSGTYGAIGSYGKVEQNQHASFFINSGFSSLVKSLFSINSKIIFLFNALKFELNLSYISYLFNE